MLANFGCWAIALLELVIGIYGVMEIFFSDIIADDCDGIHPIKDIDPLNDDTIPGWCRAKAFVGWYMAIPLVIASFVTMIGCYNEQSIGFSIIVLVGFMIASPVAVWAYKTFKEYTTEENGE